MWDLLISQDAYDTIKFLNGFKLYSVDLRLKTLQKMFAINFFCCLSKIESRLDWDSRLSNRSQMLDSC